MRAVIDTNIIIDALYERVTNCQRILDLAEKNKITPVVSQELEREYSLIAGKVILKSMQNSFKDNTLSEASFDKAQGDLYNIHRDINRFVLHNAERHAVMNHKDISPDYDDNKVINLAIESNCRTIITKNIADFRCVEQQGIKNVEGKSIMIMTPKQFMKYYEEHTKEIELEQEHIKTVNLYKSEFKQAKYFTQDDTKALMDLNNQLKKFTPIKDILNSYKITKAQISKISSQLDKIEDMDKQLQSLNSKMNEYEKHKAEVDKYEGSLLSKLMRKEGYEEVRLKMDRCETYLKSNGICSREDLDKQRSELAKMLSTKTELAHNINDLNMSLSVFTKAIEAINRALMREQPITIEHERTIALER